ncbi:MAG: N-acetylmuramoyl-L-alanine amidase [Bacillota bacterium]
MIEEKYNWAGGLSPRKDTDYIVLHHAEASHCTAQDIHQWHRNRGWAGIGYHYFVQKDGSIHRGRPRDTIGAHCQGHNYHSVGICAEGSYDKETMPPAQWKAIVSLVAELKGIYPHARVVGHKELQATACPGSKYPLEQIKAGMMPANIIEEVLSMFKDVPEGHWAKGSIERLAELGLLKGDEQGNFRPDEPLTRAQLAAVLDRLLKLLGR